MFSLLRFSNDRGFSMFQAALRTATAVVCSRGKTGHDVRAVTVWIPARVSVRQFSLSHSTLWDGWRRWRTAIGLLRTSVDLFTFCVSVCFSGLHMMSSGSALLWPRALVHSDEEDVRIERPRASRIVAMKRFKRGLG